MPNLQHPPTSSPFLPQTTSISSTRAGRRPSLSNVMSLSFLHKNSSSNSRAPYTPSKPVRISEPQFAGPLDSLATPRWGTLGSGATVVRTPQEALNGSISFFTDLEPTIELNGISPDVETEYDFPSPPESPPLPPVPESPTSMVASTKKSSFAPSRPSRPCPPAPGIISAVPSPSLHSEPLTPTYSPPRPAIKMALPLSGSGSSSPETCPPVPALPSRLGAPPQPSFDAVLLSDVPHDLHQLRPSKIIVTLETCTNSYKATLNTLISRQSHLSDYLSSLILPNEHSNEAELDDESVYSQRGLSMVHEEDTPDFKSTLLRGTHDSMNTSKQFSNRTAHLHIFLDRPSAPYAHILAYLRAPSTTSAQLLPRAAQLPQTVSSSLFQSRLDSLLELRDEADYLGFTHLHKLCNDEISTGVRQRPRLASIQERSQSHGSQHSLGSIAPIHALPVGLGLNPNQHNGYQNNVNNHTISMHMTHSRGESNSTASMRSGRSELSVHTLCEDTPSSLSVPSSPTGKMAFNIPQPFNDTRSIRTTRSTNSSTSPPNGTQTNGTSTPHLRTRSRSQSVSNPRGHSRIESLTSSEADSSMNHDRESMASEMGINSRHSRGSRPIPAATVNGLQTRLRVRERSRSNDPAHGGSVRARPVQDWL